MNVVHLILEVDSTTLTKEIEDQHNGGCKIRSWSYNNNANIYYVFTAY